VDEPVGLCLRSPTLPADLVVALVHHPEGVFVEAEPDVQAMLEDAAVRCTFRRALAAKPPCLLKDVDFVVGLS
jgi:hypothetical protein